jgi:hypothetical protein
VRVFEKLPGDFFSAAGFVEFPMAFLGDFPVVSLLFGLSKKQSLHLLTDK